MSEPLSLASALTIVEQTGEKRTLRLMGRALPYRPLTLSGTMRAEVTWYPGNPEASIQVLGSAEDECTINGFWKERFLSTFEQTESGSATAATLDDVPVTATMDLVEAMDSIRRQGQLLEVTWDSLVRYGILSKFIQKWSNRKDCEWDATFIWLGRDMVSEAATFAQEADTSTMSRTWASLLKQLEDAIELPFAAVSGMMDKVRSGANKVKAATNTINNIAEGVVDGTMNMIDTARASVAAIQSIKTAALNIADIAESLPSQMWVESASLAAQAADIYGQPGSNTSFSSDVLEGITGEAMVQAVGSASTTTPSNPTASGVSAETINSTSTGTQSLVSTPRADLLRTISIGAGLQAAVNVRKVRRLARTMAQEAVRQQDEIASRIAPDLLGHFVAADDTDLRRVSQDYYSTVEEWQRLMTFNHLSTSLLDAGQVVFVPAIRNEGM